MHVRHVRESYMTSVLESDRSLEPENTGDVEEFMIQLEQRLALLSDERTVLLSPPPLCL